ncbi:EVE domain-containing protein [Altererythrobacter buctensis]|uniref:EVE domain-containing protein n=2 Tax=Alteraurantiacibacter buctensis TaxID=1503981 RepID=A0A844Z196_9SPHN|nr:EVE domain-containing protein [Alteraurantiacibacter buctensis]MXO72474.1 EVE domain-containing protein [Alteraurantiacibacter buctensis]
MARFWLMKSEPEKYGWEQLVRDGETVWDGVRNHLAAMNLRAMEVGDQAFLYHSVSEKQITGIMDVTRAGLTDPTDPEGKWATVYVKPVRALERPVTLAEIKADPALAGIQLVRLSRLSVAEITPAEWAHICAIAAA